MTDKILIDRSVLEQALEALNASMPHNNDMAEDWPSHIAARRALRAALEQPQVEQEPEAWGSGDGYWVQHIYKQNRPNSEMYNIPFYTQPQPPRQPLTDEEVARLLESVIGSLPIARRLIRSVERAHGIGGKE